MKYIYFVSVIFLTACDPTLFGASRSQKEDVFVRVNDTNDESMEERSADDKSRKENYYLKNQLDIHKTILELHKNRISELEEMVQFYQESIKNLTKYEEMYHKANISNSEKQEQISQMHKQKKSLNNEIEKKEKQISKLTNEKEDFQERLVFVEDVKNQMADFLVEFTELNHQNFANDEQRIIELNKLVSPSKVRFWAKEPIVRNNTIVFCIANMSNVPLTTLRIDINKKIKNIYSQKANFYTHNENFSWEEMIISSKAIQKDKLQNILVYPYEAVIITCELEGDITASDNIILSAIAENWGEKLHIETQP